MNILDNELVKKYFACPDKSPLPHHCTGYIAWQVLRAMQEPIRDGDKILAFDTNCEKLVEIVSDKDLWCVGKSFHPAYLRLPDKFQKRECVHSLIARCETCGYEADAVNQPQRDAVEEKIREIKHHAESFIWTSDHTINDFDKSLRELLALDRKARESK